MDWLLMDHSKTDDVSEAFHFEHPGFCPVCEQNVMFTANGRYFRSSLICPNCKTVPRHRAFMHVLSTYFPKWRELRIHESSPGWDRVSERLFKECSAYTATQYDPSSIAGSIASCRLPCGEYRNENLEAQTFADESFDLVIMQDVFEHIFNPDLAIREIARTLCLGGALVMTVPLVMGPRPSRRLASLVNDKVEQLIGPPQFHGNPVNSGGALVTIDWGYDIASYLQRHSGLSAILIQIDNIDLGIRAQLNDVVVAYKSRECAI